MFRVVNQQADDEPITQVEQRQLRHRIAEFIQTVKKMGLKRYRRLFN